MASPHVSFIILHYMTTEFTLECVESIMKHIDYANYSIVIVDNASPNDSFTKLQVKFQDEPKVHLLNAPSNLGFAKGNNLGFTYAKENLHAEYMIITNNDTTFTQNDFITEMLHLYDKEHYHILGPDIINDDGIHQNPYRDHIITHAEVKRWIRNRQLWTCFLHVDKILRLSSYFPFFRNLYSKRENINNKHRDKRELKKNVVLQGACIIFSPAFIKEMDYAFYPETYMYCEEDILAYICHLKGYTTLFSPSLHMHHIECGSTQTIHQKQLQKEIFQSTHIVKSLKILKKITAQNTF